MKNVMTKKTARKTLKIKLKAEKQKKVKLSPHANGDCKLVS